MFSARTKVSLAWFTFWFPFSSYISLSRHASLFLSLSLFSTARFPDSPCNSTRSSFFRRYRGSGRERVRDYEDDLEKAGREMSAKEENEEKKERRESPPMNHSRRYRPIWTSSPACSKHVYLRFRVSTSRHCTRCSPSLSFSFSPIRSPSLASSSMHRYRGSAARLAVPCALNGTFVDSPPSPDSRGRGGSCSVWTPRLESLLLARNTQKVGSGREENETKTRVEERKRERESPYLR